MCNLIKVLLLTVMWCLPVVAESEEEYTEWYVGAQGGVLLPSGHGTTLRRAAQATALVGYSVDETLAIEGAFAYTPNACWRRGNEMLTTAEVDLLCHLAYIDEVNNLFGYERFDPFVTLGVAASFGSHHAFGRDDARRTAFGPAFGLGAFYHLTDNLALRCDARAHVGVESAANVLYSVGVGLQWSFE